jgi:hypothetical protein
LKRRQQQQLPLSHDEFVRRFLIGAYHDFKPATVEVNIWRTFEEHFFHQDISDEPSALLFDE